MLSLRGFCSTGLLLSKGCWAQNINWFSEIKILIIEDWTPTHNFVMQIIISVFNNPSSKKCQLIWHKSCIFNPVNVTVVFSVIFHIENEGLNDELRNLCLVFPENEVCSTCRKGFHISRVILNGLCFPWLHHINLSLVTSQVRQGNICSSVSHYLLLQTSEFPAAPLGMLSDFQLDTCLWALTFSHLGHSACANLAGIAAFVPVHFLTI